MVAIAFSIPDPSLSGKNPAEARIFLLYENKRQARFRQLGIFIIGKRQQVSYPRDGDSVIYFAH